MDPRLSNILVLSLGFMLVFTSFQTMSNILITMISSIKHEITDFDGDAFYAMFIVYGVLAIFNFLVPLIMSVIGSRFSMMIGAICYTLYIGSFFVMNKAWMLYAASAVLGVGAAMIWTAQGTYLTLNSDAYTVARNSAIFWALFQCSSLFGNLFVTFAFQDKDYIPNDSRVLVFGGLCGVSIVGFFCLMLLKSPYNLHGHPISDATRAPAGAFTRAFAIIFTKDMLLLSFAFWFTGVHLAFSSTIYSACIGFTVKLTKFPKSLIGISGILFGLGEVFGGALFGVLADRTTFNWGRNPIVVFGSAVILGAYALIYLNLPDDAVLADTINVSFFDPPKVWIALLCSFMLGFGDSCFNTQIYSIVATVFREDSAPSFAVFKFIQSVASGVAFLFFKFFSLHYLLIALAVLGIIATIGFVPVEIEARTPHFDPDELDIRIPAGPSVNRALVAAPKSE